jgi:hypothetical protein
MRSSVDAGRVDTVPPFEVRDSHRGLLAHLDPLAVVEPMPHQGLVMVPATRTEQALDTASALAGALDWPLLVLCSRGLRPPDVRRRVCEGPDASVRLVAASVAPGEWLRARRPWACTEHAGARRRADIDTNRKRNIGIAVAVMTGHDRILFVDDDVLGLEPGDVVSGLAHLHHRPDHDVVGWPAVDFPDNSVVHHARRDYLGRPQTCFVGGGSLLVRLAERRPPGFPPVYNEDWLFLYDAVEAGRVALGRDVRQLAKDVYGQVGRAASEEFGDVLAEGLYHLLHVGAPVEAAMNPRYWDSVRGKRERMHARILERLRELYAAGPDDDRVGAALRAVDGSRHELTRSTSESLADFVTRWRTDLDTWDDFIGHLPPRDTLKEALVYLGVHEAWIVTT